MPEFISTESVILISIWCRKMPELFKCIQQYSTASKKEAASTPIALLSAQQIQEARQHPSNFIRQALKTTAIIQIALNTSLVKLDALAKQRKRIESDLVALSTLGSAKEDQGITIDKSIEKKLQQQLVELRQAEKELESITSELDKKLDSINTILQQHSEEWSKHREEYFNQLAAQLETHDIVLTDEEKAELRRGSTTASSIQEKLSQLEKSQISLPSRMSDFAIVTYDIIVAAQSRKLQKVDKKTAKNIARSLSAINDESEASSTIKSAQAKQHEEIIITAKQLEEKITAVLGLSLDELHLLKNVEQQVEAIHKTEKAMPAA
jgi:hypothetical protein